MIDVLNYVLETYAQDATETIENFVLLQPTSPFRRSTDIDVCYQVMLDNDVKSAVSVHEVQESPYECIRVGADGMEMLAEAGNAVRRQDYKDAFQFINGALYMVSTDFFRKHNALIKLGQTALYEMPPLRGLDIDTPDDLMMAQAIAAHPSFQE